MFNNNLINITNCKNKDFDFSSQLDLKKTIIIKNCLNLSISVKSKINKIIVENSQFIKLNICGLISGLEITKSKIILDPFNNFSISIIELYKSSLFLLGDLNLFLNLLIKNEQSDIYNIS